jgi:transcriptional antiterminator NusG
MNDPEVEKMLAIAERPDQTTIVMALQFKKGDRVKIREGSFENFEGEVEAIDEQKQTVTVLITIFGRSTPVDVEYWNLERI